MAKGRRLTISRSERFLGGYGYAHTHESDDNDGLTEFGEEDVWSDGADATDDSSGEWHSLAAHESVGRRRIARRGGGLTFAFEDSPASPRIVFRGNDGAASAAAASPLARHVASSAPMNVPDWSKIYRVNSVESMEGSSSEGVEEMGMIPPHEYVARSRSNKSGGASVFEGMGRTLKGRDLRRVRDAVWRQTGFDG